jgi:hypothetical protein
MPYLRRQREKKHIPTIAVLAQHILNILTNQFETKHIFIDEYQLVCIVHLEMTSNPQIGCMGPINIALACQVEFDLLTKLKAKFENQNEGKDLLNFHDS